MKQHRRYTALGALILATLAFWLTGCALPAREVAPTATTAATIVPAVTAITAAFATATVAPSPTTAPTLTPTLLPTAPPLLARPVSLTILHTNDTRGYVDPCG